MKEKLIILEYAQSDNKTLIEENMKLSAKMNHTLAKLKSLQNPKDKVQQELKLVSAINIFEKITGYVLDMIFDGTLFDVVGGEVGEQY